MAGDFNGSLTTNASVNLDWNLTVLNDTDMVPVFERSQALLALGIIGLIAIITTFICALILVYITIRHGYGSVTANVLILNWVICCCIFGICSSILTFHQSVLRRRWPFGLSSCIVTTFLEDFCYFPKETIPALLCVVIYRQVLLNKTGPPGCLARVPTFVWVTLAIWILIYDSMLGSFRLAVIGKAYIAGDPEAVHCYADNFHHAAAPYIIKAAGNYMLLGFFVPLISVITVGVLTIKRTKITKGYIDSPLSEKLKVRQLILALMSIMIVHNVLKILFPLILPFFTVGLERHFFMSTAVMLALIFCHREFCNSLPFRKAAADDNEPVLPPMAYAQLNNEAL